MTVEQAARDFFGWFNRHYPAPSTNPDHEWNRLGVVLANHQEEAQAAPEPARHWNRRKAVDELIELLRSLARHEHSDVSIAEEAADALEAARVDAEKWRKCNTTHDIGDGERIECHVIVCVNVYNGKDWCGFEQPTPDEFFKTLDAIDQARGKESGNG